MDDLPPTLLDYGTDIDSSKMVDNDIMEIKLLLIGPKDERNLDECLGGMGSELYTLTRYGEVVLEHEFTDHELEDYVEPNMLVSNAPGPFLSPLRRGLRRIRRRGRSWGVQLSCLFGSQSPFTSQGVTKHGRKNNDRWSEDEMRKLVQSVSIKGVGRWSKVKEDHFPTSIRTAVNLKDKWRNLVKACRAKVKRRKKVKVQEATELIVREFKQHILAIDAGKNPARKKKRSNNRSFSLY
ncbi:hypothetical protein EJB05_22190 [Eragrostis curvula]|uniref:Uncharacterized protein n=1 Tax=Eragrostis curvula TaxID=38414 RepID=A0A5J9V5G4_9POAL|nr:hypothetical protein EJB05_22190 [Eragrostis curvula]